MLRRLWRAAVALLAALGFVVVVVTATPLVDWWARRLSGDWTDARGETLIVLGGSMLDQGVIGDSSYWRSVYAARTYADGFRRVVISGGGYPGNPAAAAMRQFLICQGVPAAAITIETESTSTRQNALYTARLLAGDSSRQLSIFLFASARFTNQLAFRHSSKLST